MTLMENTPIKSQWESDEPIKKRETEWTHELPLVSTWSTIVNDCQIAWESPNGPWNEGNILYFWEFASGEAKWDVTVDRKAGGLTNTTTLNHLSRVTVKSSSVMALIMGVVFHVVHDGTCLDNLKNAFTSLKVTLCIGASADEIINMSIKKNIDQHKRKRHTEFEHIPSQAMDGCNATCWDWEVARPYEGH
jgi:hypothetical protein